MAFFLYHFAADIDVLGFQLGQTTSGATIHIVQGKTKTEGQFGFLYQADKMRFCLVWDKNHQLQGSCVCYPILDQVPVRNLIPEFSFLEQISR